MRKGEGSLAMSGAVVLAVGRAALVFFGTTFAAHRLATNTTNGRFRPLDQQGFTAELTGAELAPYGSWVTDAVAINGDLSRSMANTVLIGLLALLFGAVLGWLLAGLLRLRGLGRVVAGLHAPIMAIAVPGVLLFPAYRLAESQQLLPEGPSPADQTASGSVAFVLFWAATVGLAIAPGLAGQFTTDQRFRAAGPEIAALSGASRPARFGTFELGIPTAVLVLGVASAELMSGHNGLFSHVGDRLGDGDLASVLDVVVVVALLGAALVLAADLITVFTDPGADPDTADRPTAVSDATWPLLAILTVLTVMAAVGYLRDPVLAADTSQALRTPTVGGPWLGTDGAGASLVERLVVALGPTMVSALIPGTLAALIGFAINRLSRRGPAPIGRSIDAVLDVAWWPLPLLIPLAHLNVGNPQRSEVDPVVTLVTVAALTPLAVRAMGRNAGPSQDGRRHLISVLVFLIAIAGSVRIFVGFLGVTNGPHGPSNADLGAMVASTHASSDLASGWSVTAPALAGFALLSFLYWLAGAISSPSPFRPLAPVLTPIAAAEPWSTDREAAEVSPVVPSAAGMADEAPVRVGPLNPQDLRAVGRLSEAPAPPEGDITIGRTSDADPLRDETIDIRDQTVKATPVQRRPVVNLAARLAADQTEGAAQEPTPGPDLDEAPPASDDASPPADVRTEQAVAGGSDSVGDRVEASAGDRVDDSSTDGIDGETQAELDMLNATSIDLAAEASKTIELRPSTLRRAGIIAPGASSLTGRSNDRPILAARTEHYDSDGNRTNQPTADEPAPSDPDSAHPGSDPDPDPNPNPDTDPADQAPADPDF